MIAATPTPSETIVVVDDNRAILDVVSSMIRSVLGAPVRCFQSPAAALRDFTSRPEECCLVISDFNMPGMNGADLLRTMQTRRPNLSMILFSGSTDEEIAAGGLPANCPILPKAGGFPTLMQMVERLAAA